MTTTTIWKIQVPVGAGFAELNRHYKEPSGKKCPKCGSIIEDKRETLTVEWEDGSDQIGDFVHAGAEIILQDRVAKQLRRIATGFTAAAIAFYDHPNLRKPATVPDDDTETRIWLPYKGPTLSQLIVDRKVALADRSTVEIDRICESCSTIRYKRILGVEKKTRSIAKPRVDGKGLFVHADDLKGDGIFSPIGTSLTLCTNKVKVFMESEGFSNVEFLEYGDVI